MMVTIRVLVNDAITEEKVMPLSDALSLRYHRYRSWYEQGFVFPEPVEGQSVMIKGEEKREVIIVHQDGRME